jgi:uncharacterized protein (DUF1684 family)
MLRTNLFVLVLVALIAGCARDRWPEPSALDPAEYQKAYAAWRADRQETIAFSLPIVGIWPLAEGDTAFGADTTLPVALRAAGVPERAGVLRRTGFDVTVIPARGANLRTVEGAPLDQPSAVSFEQGFTVGSIRLELTGAADGRLWVTGTDTDHPAVKNPPAAEAYPLDPRWRVAARFEAFDAPRQMKVPDVRGGTIDFTSVGQLVFRVNGEEARLTAIEAGDDSLAALFKDPTNQSTTYAGYRIVQAKKVASGEWTAIDFNLAYNPPCAFSQYTVCPLPPPENRLQVAVEAGEKRLPSAQGYVPPSTGTP